MPVLENAKHERFAQELAKGKTADEAYVLAGYTENRKNASRLKSNEDIRGRVAELQDRGAKRAEVTVQTLLDEADQVFQAAYRAGQFSAAIAAIKEKGVLSGKRVERSEQGNPGDFDQMSEDELAAFILIEAAAVSKEVH